MIDVETITPDLFELDITTLPDSINAANIALILDADFREIFALLTSGKLPYFEEDGIPIVKRDDFLDYIKAQVLSSIDAEKLDKLPLRMSLRQFADFVGIPYSKALQMVKAHRIMFYRQENGHYLISHRNACLYLFETKVRDVYDRYFQIIAANIGNDFVIEANDFWSSHCKS